MEAAQTKPGEAGLYCSSLYLPLCVLNSRLALAECSRLPACRYDRVRQGWSRCRC